ncbi:protein asunder [Stomoxys calcitrans]|uniref:Protein asunder n=1 Tax=Stomoxys calcitrans TaxID=35570 RepID=A0A1I8Q3Q7_STOCA|nr:protein asunder [Stomoxys calcitrans]
MYDINQKTIFVLDHTQYFSISSEDYIPLDFLKGKATNPSEPSVPSGSQPGLQFSKSLWTSSVESSIEYCRIVWDLFPRGKLIRFIVSDTAAHIVNTWKFATQNMSHVLNAMALVGVPQRNTPQSSDYSVIHGLRAAIEALAEPTEHQINLIQAQELSANNEKIPNKGRVICITSARDNPSMKSLEDIFHNVLVQQNTLALAQKKLLTIDHCHLVIINMVPMNIESLVTNRHKMELSPCLSTEIHTTCAPDISNKLTHLIMSHYDLASTTVTGIPMKEEQNANSSANYDVEILHARNAHTAICGNEALLPTSIKEGAEYETVTLKWCTPRGCGASDMSACPPCLAQHRVTPVDVTSRPSSCLINFLLNGRSVLLEMPRKTGGKTTSHLLSARGGEIFIHALQITRSCLEDPPSISEGPGGRITDYRIPDFAALIKSHRLLPLKTKTKPEENLQFARERLYNRSLYFPLTMTTTIVFNLQRSLPWLPNFLRKIAKDDMDKTDEMQCQQNIYELYTAASTRRELLPFTNMSANRLKGHKKVDQYKLFCAELEVLIKSCAKTPHHKAILESIQNVRAACGDAAIKSELDGTRDAVGKSIIRATTDSPLSPPHSMDTSSAGSSHLLKAAKRNFANVGRSLFDIVTSAERSQSSKRPDFSGRLCTPVGQVAKLYPEFGLKEAEGSAAATPVKDENLPIKLEVPGIRT